MTCICMYIYAYVIVNDTVNDIVNGSAIGAVSTIMYDHKVRVRFSHSVMKYDYYDHKVDVDVDVRVLCSCWSLITKSLNH